MAPSIPQKLALTLLTNGGRLVGIVHLQTQAMEFFYYYWIYVHWEDVKCVNIYASCIFSVSLVVYYLYRWLQIVYVQFI
jgi:hypothetical protein